LSHPWLAAGDRLSQEELRQEILTRYQQVEKALAAMNNPEQKDTAKS
jgi:hypothetical protein